MNQTLLALAQAAVNNRQVKKAVAPAGGGMPPGAPPMDPAMMGGAPPMDPAMMGGAPPMDPAMMGGGMPMDPAMMGGGMPPGAPPMDPAMMGGAPPAPVDPATGAAAPQKMKPDEYMRMIDFRLYNMQQQLTLIINSMGLKLDPGVLVTPPGAPSPPPEAAMPGGSNAPKATTDPQGPPTSADMVGTIPTIADGGVKSGSWSNVTAHSPNTAEKLAAVHALLVSRQSRR